MNFTLTTILSTVTTINSNNIVIAILNFISIQVIMGYGLYLFALRETIAPTSKKDRHLRRVVYLAQRKLGKVQ